MTIAGAQGAAASQTITASVSGKGKADGANSALNNVSFLGVAKEVAESAAGKIVTAGGADIEDLDFLRHRSEFENRVPEKIETVYDFIAEIRNILKGKKRK